MEETIHINITNQIIAYATQMQSNGRATETINTAITKLKYLARLTDLTQPEKVKQTIAQLNIKNNTKQTLARIYG